MISPENKNKLIEALKARLLANPNEGQIQTLTAALESAGLTGVIQASSANASQYIRQAKGLKSQNRGTGSPRPVGDQPSPELNGLKPSEAIHEAEKQIAKALRELEHERTVKMNEVRDLDDLIARYKHFQKGGQK